MPPRSRICGLSEIQWQSPNRRVYAAGMVRIHSARRRTRRGRIESAQGQAADHALEEWPSG